MSAMVHVERIDIRSNTRRTIEDAVALETPVNILVNDEYVITLLSTPELQSELALGWLFGEGVLQSFDAVERIVPKKGSVNVITRKPIDEENLRVVGVSRLLTTACGLSASKFFKITTGTVGRLVDSDYQVRATEIVKIVEGLGESELFQATGGVHVAALFEGETLVALVEDVGRHNAVDKAVGTAIQSKVDFSRCVLASSGRQPADMVLKAARVGIPIVASKAAPIRSGIIAAERTGVTLVCFVRDQRMNVYTHPRRILVDE